MSVVVAFMWNKSPRPSISTMAVDIDTIAYLVKPEIHYLNESFSKFKKSAKKQVSEFFVSIKELEKNYKKPIRIEYKILFLVHGMEYMQPAKESLFIYKLFKKYLNKITRKSKLVKAEPQLRKKLSGKALVEFKKKLQSFYLVSRKQGRGFEYHLWSVALHTTRANYKVKLKRVHRKLNDKMWSLQE